MGKALFDGFLSEMAAGTQQAGVDWLGEFASWESLLERGRERASLVQPQGSYLVAATCGHEAFASFFAVATVPDTLLLWARAEAYPGPLTQVAAGLYRIDDADQTPRTRPLWGTLTSGSAGRPKVPLGYADQLDLVAMHYDAVLYGHLAGDGSPPTTLATSLPLEYGASFMMVVLPSIFGRRNLVVYPPHDWSALVRAAQTDRTTACLTVPGIAVAGTLSIPEPLNLPNLHLFMASGYLTAERALTLRERLGEVGLLNCYGATETGVVTLDRDAGGNLHVGQPIMGKPVWIEDPDDTGLGAIATTGLDCREFYWRQEEPLRRPDGVVAVTDLGRFDAEGNLHLMGRIDGGEKLHGLTVYPQMIERHLLTLDGCADVKVSVINAGGTDKLVAKVVGRATEAQVREKCLELSEIERPALVECVDETVEAYSRNGKL